MAQGLPLRRRRRGNRHGLTSTQERDAVAEPASRAARYHCRIEGKLAPFPYRIHMEDCGMKLFVGLHVSLEKTAICVISEPGKIVQEAQAASEPAPCSNGCTAG